MKLKGLMTLCLAGAATFGVNAQTHVEGQEYYKADQIENAKDLLTRALNNPGTNKALADYYLGMIAVRENKMADATKYFDQGIAADAENAYNYVGKGLVALKAGDFNTARNFFKDGQKYAKKDPGVEIAVARAYAEVDPVKYEKDIAKCVEKARKYDMKNPEIYVFEGDQMRVAKNIGGAAAKYEMAANYDSDFTPAYVKYANLFTMVNPDYAIKMLGDLLAKNPNSALGQRELANAYYNKGDYANAAKQYAAYVNNPSHFKSDENRYAFLLFYSGDFKKGYDYATKLLKEDPNDFAAQRFQFINAAQIPEMKDQYLPMAEALYAAHLKNPEANKFAAIDYTLIADELSKAKRTDEAVKVLQEGMKAMPDNASFDKQLAMLYVDESDLVKAANAFKGYLDKTEEPSYNDYIQQATFLYYAGVQNKDNAAEAQKYYNEEQQVLDKAAAAYPGFYKPNKMRGDIAKQTASKDQVEKAAAPLYMKAIAEFESIPADKRSKGAINDAKEMYNYMGNYYLDQKDTASAKKYFNKYLELDPNNTEYRKFVEKL